MSSGRPTYIIFGASGDLAKRYLLPAAAKLKEIIGDPVLISRKDYPNLKDLIKGGEKIFHLAIPPEGVTEAIEIISENFGKNKIKILLEKPFGDDLESAKKLVEFIDERFDQDQIYRVDHYLAKKSLQNLKLEGKDTKNISKIEVLASEKIDIEGRVNFYEQTGALKDFVQSHLLEMTAVTLAGSFNLESRVRALRNLEVICDVTKSECVKRGQYEGYKDEVRNPDSTTETFVSINMVSNDPSWRGVAIALSTGKALLEKRTEVIINYKDGKRKVFNIEHEPDAYEHVIKSAVNSERDLFIGRGEVLESWRILHSIQETWKHGSADLIIYKKGSNISTI